MELSLLPWLLLLLPLVSAALIRFVFKKAANLSAYIGTASVAATFGINLMLLTNLGAESLAEIKPLKWFEAGSFSIDLGVTVDQLAVGMMFVVTTIGLLVHLFSLGYMKDDAGKSRYFAGLSLFMFSMTGIVLSDNFLMMFIFWELVGVSSYILIGHWFEKNSAAEASKKAFLTNRIGDFGFMAGILILFGATGTVSFTGIEAAFAGANAPIAGGLLTLAVLGIFCGAVGKSAQLPLHVWLPDAMEGPTPVSALIHAATMVAAGVYMLVRVSFLIESDACAANVIAWIGGITALLAALMATQQSDIKRVLAYSTLSQLGYMVMAVGLLAGYAGMFHLFTHAFFKALLFLGSGAVIYACHHEQDIWKMGGLFKKMPLTAITFIIGTLALIAVPGMSGFWSKEAILHAAEDANPALFWIAVFVAFLTTFYMTRLVIVTFFGKARAHGAEEAKEVGPTMLLPLLVLAVLSVIAGFGFFGAKFMPEAFHSKLHWGDHPAEVAEGSLALIASITTLVLGLIAATVLYKGKDKDPISIPLFRNKFYIDEIYAWVVRLGQDLVAFVANVIDRFVIGGAIVRGAAGLCSGAGLFFRRIQSGNLQAYALMLGVGAIVIIYIALN
ncbi:NADH-quinone oxidoreductase subunit L [Sulfuriroseicoccus oceanibius]|uniref:NADH-quinone oxidoreductase subunit L n=1 Tax=Sulfuriroseicoccus oceanibius TaxID=2707525 RepID=A0A6B3L993_9BACT|nr:NADH-quinone oxidoreductase subunit L [Sulfuriroseicoccus oceanibius]QQL44271.1 NADH-quinone oxidoreductase subunit L [Sulfuriroseicoccus oceanibius]